MKWSRKRLAEIAEFRLGKMLDQEKNRGELRPYLANINVRWGEFDFSELREMRFEHDELDQYGLEYGDIVMCEGGEPGRCAIWKEEFPGMMVQKALHRIRPHPGIDYRFLHYTFVHKGRIGAFSALFTGSTIKHLPKQQLAKVEIEYPELEVQRRIAEVLSGYDDLIENNRRRITLLERSARLLYDEWFLRLRFPGFEHTRFQDRTPMGWGRISLEAVCDRECGIQTGPFGSQLHQADYTDDGVPVVMPKDIVNCRVATDDIARVPEDKAQKLSRHRVAVGDILYGRRGELGRRAYVSEAQCGWLCGTGCLRIRPDPKLVNPRFLFDLLGTQEIAGEIANRAKGTTMLNLNSTIFKSISVVLPPRTLQNLYADHVGSTFRQIEVLQTTNQKLRTVRDLLLPKLMSGEIAV